MKFHRDWQQAYTCPLLFISALFAYTTWCCHSRFKSNLQANIFALTQLSQAQITLVFFSTK